MPAEVISPLADYFEGHSRAKKPLRVKTIVLAGGLALAVSPIAGTVLAADITTGTQSAEFGQGSLQARECDDLVTIALITSWSASEAFFAVDQVDLGDVNLTNCTGKTLTVSAYSSTGAQLDLSSGSGSSLFYDVTSATVASPITGTSSSAIIPLDVGAVVNSVDIEKVTVETSDTAG